MAEAVDQIFVNLKHALLAAGWITRLPPFVQWLGSALLTIAPIVAVFGGLFAITTVVERKGLGRIQNRIGPNRVGLFQFRLWGFGQFIADGIKALVKEDVVPRAADRVVHFAAPIALVVPVLLAYAVLPFG